jgi:hypothetical protein
MKTFRIGIRGIRGSLAAALLVACGAGPVPAPSVPALPPSPPEPPPDLSAVPTPAGIVIYARASHPSATLQMALGWARLPMPTASRDLGHELAGEDIGEVVDTDRPIDFALVNGGRGMVPAWASASGVRSVEAVRAALPENLTLVPGKSRGTFWIRPAHDATEGTTEHPCEVVPSAGPSSLRLVCGASDDALEYLAPYLTRTAPRQAWDADLHVELYTEPIKPFARMLRLQAPALLESMLGLDTNGEPAIRDLVTGALGDAVDLLGDLATTKVDLELDAEGAHVKLEAGFSESASVVARLATGYPERADAPLASFWRLSDESDTALWSRGYDPKNLERARDLLLGAAESVLSKEGMSTADRTALRGSFDRILSDAPFVFARGSDVVAMQKSLALFQSAEEGPAKEAAARAAVEPYIGWWVFGFDEPPARLTGVMRALVGAMSRPSMSLWLKKHVEGVPPPVVRLAAAPPGLPSGALHVVLAVYVKPDDPKEKARPVKPIELHALLVPDAGGAARTWMVLASDPQLALAKVKGLLASSTSVALPGPGTLATRTRLDILREGKSNGGGFSSLRAWVALSPEPVPGVPGKAGDPLALLASLPHQGQTPITISTLALPKNDGGAKAGAYAARLFMPKEAIEDFVLFHVRQSASPMSVRPSGGKI